MSQSCPFKAVCIKDDWDGPAVDKAPKIGDVVKVISVYEKFGSKYNPFYILDGYDMYYAYTSKHFTPVQYDDITAELANKMTETNETPDKILAPEKVLN